MEFPKISLSDNSVLETVKSKLGIQDRREADDDYDQDYNNYEAYDDYDTYADDSYVDDYSDYTDEYGSYDDYERNRSHAGADTQYRASALRHDPQPSLVSLDDVRDTSHARKVNAENEAARRQDAGAYTYHGVSSTIGLSANMPERKRSEGLNSLFSSTDRPEYAQGQPSAHIPSIWDDPVQNQAEQHSDFARARHAQRTTEASPAYTAGSQSAFAASPAHSSAYAAPQSAYAAPASTATAYDPYDAYAGSGASFATPKRAVVVLKPSSYSEVERIAKTVRTGDVLVLALHNTSSELSKRVLDFSFGVASALSARVDCIADKVFAINCGEAINASEMESLHNQGVL